MKLSEVKKALITATAVNFELPDGTMVPEHFHVTEVGMVTKHFIDCGGTVRNEKLINFQLWNANDVDHRLKPQKLSTIIALSEKVLGVEYQAATIGKYDLEYANGNFKLIAKQTDCLAPDKCGIPEKKPRVSLASLQNKNSCDPKSGCC
jgi:Family of unknown function (DUF6428)